jgi:hypothetical protein
MRIKCQPSHDRSRQSRQHSSNLTLIANSRIPSHGLEDGTKAVAGEQNSSTPCSYRRSERANNLALQTQ